MSDLTNPQNKSVAMFMGQSGTQVKIIAARDIEILASCDCSDTYSRSCGNYFLNANDQVIIPVPAGDDPHMHVRFAKHSGAHDQIGGSSPWAQVDLNPTNRGSCPTSMTSMSSTH